MWVGPKVSYIQYENLLSPKRPTYSLVDAPGCIVQGDIPTVYMQVEPEAIVHQEFYLLQNYHRYTHILTFNDNVLKSCPNAYKYVYGTSRFFMRGADPKTMEDVKTLSPDQKQFKVTSVFNDKMMTIGHAFRRQVFLNQGIFHGILPIACAFFIAGDSGALQPNSTHPQQNPRLGESKWDMFHDAQFHLTIENSRQVNYFTEKLCDALITYTIPIYYGCPNISEYFDTTGWIILEDENLSTLANALYQLTPDHYERHKETVLKNHELCKQYMSLEVNLNRGLKQIQDL
jgi:hypothetical protein